MSKAKKSRMGRPPLAKGQVKDVMIVVRLTPAFHKALCAAAKNAGKCVTHYVRDTLTEKLNQEP
jgi:predicted HicB family RNase H-like nuclease